MERRARHGKMNARQAAQNTGALQNPTDQGGRYDSHLALDGLLFARRIAGRLHREEWMNTSELLPTGVLTGSDGVLASAGHHVGQQRNPRN
jgi:hypothetical protein